MNKKRQYHKKQEEQKKKHEEEAIAEEQSIKEMAKMAGEMLLDKRYEPFKKLIEFSINLCKDELVIVGTDTRDPRKSALDAAFISGRIHQARLILDAPETYTSKLEEYKQNIDRQNQIRKEGYYRGE